MADDLRQAALLALDDLIAEAKAAGNSAAWLTRRRDAVLAAFANPAVKKAHRPLVHSSPVEGDEPPQWLPPSKFGEWDRMQKDLANSSAPIPGHDRVLRLVEVLRIVGVGKTTWRGMVDRGEAPKGFLISARCIGWSERTIHAFLRRRQQTQATGSLDAGEEEISK